MPVGPVGRWSADDGFTIVEVMVAVFIFTVVSTASIMLIVRAAATIRENSDRVFAANLASSEIERLRELGPSAITIGNVTTEQVTSEGRFTVSTTSNWVGLNQTADACSSANPGNAFMRVHVEVVGGRLAAPQESDTLISPPDDSPAANVGSAAVKVVDGADQPVPGIRVSGRDLAGTSTFAYVTGPDGCIFVPNLTPSGSWQFSVDRVGYVGSPDSPTIQVHQVAIGQSTPVQFRFAQAASLTFTAPPGDFPIPAQIPVSYGSDPASIATLATNGFPTTVGSLWPAPTGYQAWLGTCQDADPSAGAAPRRTSVPRSVYASPPGGLEQAVLGGAPLKVRGLLAGTAVRIRHAAEATGRCSSPVTYDLGVTGSKGVVRAFVPFGRWTVIAPGTPDLEVTLDPDDANPVVSFPVANLDIPCPSASPSASASPSGGPVFPPASPAPTPTCAVTP